MPITCATPSDLARLEPLAREFYASSRFLVEFDLDRFVALWTHLIESGAGVIFLLEEDGEIAGTIGGVVYPEAYSPLLIATEFFWYVRDGLRGSGLKLYRKFEDWARSRGCGQVRMIHLLDSMPEKLERVYKHLGFEAAEVHYTKEIKP
jgi:GNAT superfamily N-acetyltransferase